MPIRVSDLVAERRPLVVKLRGGTMEIVYRPQELTPAREEQIAAALDESDETDARSSVMLEMLCELVAQWDLVGPVVDKETGEQVVGEDEPVPLNPEVIRFVPSTLISKTFSAIYEDMGSDAEGKGKRSKNSGGGSFSRG